MSNQEPKPKKLGIDYFNMPGASNKTTIEDVMLYFKNEIPGKTLTTHLAINGPEDIVTASVIQGLVVEDSTVIITTLDRLSNPTTLRFDGSTSKFVPSIYEEGDFWFNDPSDDRIWYGIYDTVLMPLYIEKA